MSAPSNPYAALSHKINKTLSSLALKFQPVETLDELLDALLKLEMSVGPAITRKLGSYDIDKKINAQMDHSVTLIPLSRALFQAYYLVSSDQSVMRDVTKLLGPVAKQIGFTINKHAQPHGKVGRYSVDCSTRQAEFAGAVSQVVMVCLAVSSRTKAGKSLLVALASSKATITVEPVYKEERSSLLMVEAPVKSVYCTSLAPGANLETRLSQVKPAGPDGARLANTFSAPVWLVGTKQSAGELTYLSFAPGPGGLAVEDALAQVLTGSVSFDLKFQPFYCPPRIDVLHEIAHAIHNATGENRKGIALDPPDGHLWDDAEEAWTIAFDPIGQNAQAADIDLQAAQGHSGLYLTDLAPGTEVSDLTLRQISRNPTKPTTKQDDNCIVM